MSTAKTPISVVIPTYNGQALLAKHLPDVADALQPGDEIVVVDDASQDETLFWLEKQREHYQQQNIDLRILALMDNHRFAAAVNSGVAAATHRYVFLLNNDVSPLSKNLKENLLTWFKNDEDLFAVGCAEVRQKSSNKIYGRGTGTFARGLFVHWYDPDQDRHDTLWTAGGSMMVDKEKFTKLGGFDTLFYPAYEEDRDLSYQALKHGYKIIFDYQTKVHHQHESTNESVFGSRQMEINSWKNQWLLSWKNISNTSFWLQHLMWLPYHLTISAVRTKGASILGLVKAVRQLPQLWQSRQKASRLWNKTDQEILNQFSFARKPQQ